MIYSGKAVPVVDVGDTRALSGGSAKSAYVYSDESALSLDAGRSGMQAGPAVPVRILTYQQAEALGIEVDSGSSISVVLVSGFIVYSGAAEALVAINDYAQSAPPVVPPVTGGMSLDFSDATNSSYITLF